MTCTFGQINNGADAYVDIQVSADQDGQAQNQATVSAAHVVDETPGNDTSQLATQIEPVADLGVTKTESADPVYALTDLTYTIQVSNAGPSTATEVTVTDTLDASLTYVSATPSQGDCDHEAGVVTCDLGSVNQGGTPTIELVVRPAQPPGEDANYTVDNTAQVSSAAYDANSANDSDAESTTVNRALALVDLSITKTDGADPVLVDSNITYTITVANGGPDDAEDVTVSDVLPQGLSYVSAEATQGTCGEAGGTVTCQVGTLLNGNNSVITLVVTADSGGPNREHGYGGHEFFGYGLGERLGFGNHGRPGTTGGSGRQRRRRPGPRANLGKPHLYRHHRQPGTPGRGRRYLGGYAAGQLRVRVRHAYPGNLL